ncbi:MAG TPA: hypothetical protein VKH17_00980 [Acidimicrobiia bacterium]|nr:hypothetical protein [Acidimicrobiia bacterium]
MGLFKKLKQFSGSVDKDLLENGLLGRGTIVEVQQTNVSTGGDDAFSRPVCIFTVEVVLDNVAPYNATCRQSIPITVLPQIVPGQSVVAVRVNPDNHDVIALDLATEPPEVTLAQGSGQATAADVLARGTPVRAVIVQTQPLGVKNPHGVDMHAFVLTVMLDGQKPYQAKVGNPVPDDAVPLLYPGSNLPAKVLPEEPQGVVIDFKAALEEFTK